MNPEAIRTAWGIVGLLWLSPPCLDELTILSLSLGNKSYLTFNFTIQLNLKASFSLFMWDAGGFDANFVLTGGLHPEQNIIPLLSLKHWNISSPVCTVYSRMIQTSQTQTCRGFKIEQMRWKKPIHFEIPKKFWSIFKWSHQNGFATDLFDKIQEKFQAL